MIYEQKPSVFVLLHFYMQGCFTPRKTAGYDFFLAEFEDFSGEGSNSLDLGCLGHVTLLKHVWDIVS